jgi:DNA-binding MltR family transcriptional regulator
MPENNDGDFQPTLIIGKDLERHFKLQDALLEYSKLFHFEEQNDRALVIVGAAFLDTLLANILITFLIDDEKEVEKLLQYDQPLGTYGNRIGAAYCLGLIGKTVRDDLRLVGKIRNRFAHDLYASFEDQKIQSWCSSLRWHREAYMKPPAEASVRELFYVGVHQLVAHLDGVVSIARYQKRQRRPDLSD